MTELRRSGEYLCVGCNGVVSNEDAASVWFESGLGLACLRTHEHCQEAAIKQAEIMGWIWTREHDVRPELDENEPADEPEVEPDDDDEEDPW